MSALNLVAKDKTQEIILQYLQENASESLANKINNGVKITLDGVELINRKSLDEFMTFASGEARKTTDKNTSSACVEDATVFGWAIHYFEEDSVLGALFNVDGTPYKAVKAQNTATATTGSQATLPIPKSDPSGQMSIFDLDTSCRGTDSEMEDEMDCESGCDIVEIGTEVDSECSCETDGEIDTKCDICEVKQQMPLPTGGDIELESAIRGKVMTADGEFVDYVEFDGDIEESALEIQPITTTNAQQPPITPPKLDKRPLGSIIYERYMSGHERYPKAMVATKVGDFYEFFADSAIAVSSEFDLTLTGRDCGFESRVPMCGIPYHCAEKYFGWILENHDLLIVEGDNTMKYTPKYPTQEELLIAENATCASDLASTSRTSEHEVNIDNMAVATDTNVAKNAVVTSPTMTAMLTESRNRIRELLALFGECLEVRI